MSIRANPPLLDRQFRAARVWSNRQLESLAHLFDGSVVNVSGSDDQDKEGRRYRDYFCNASKYALTNYSGAEYRGYTGRADEVPLDLSRPLADELSGKYDVVFNHTTLEHIFDINLAFDNLCGLSRDVVIVIVPFAQVQHEHEAFRDYWRFTPTCVRALFERNSFEVVYEAANDDFNTAVYFLMVASRQPSRWAARMPHYEPLEEISSWLGSEPSFAEIQREFSRYLRFRRQKLLRPLRGLGGKVKRLFKGAES